MNIKFLTVAFLIIFNGYMLYNMTNTNFREFTYEDNIFSYYVKIKKLTLTEGKFCMNSECKNINPDKFINMSPFEVYDHLFSMPINTNKTEFNSIVNDTKIIANYYLEDIFSYITASICFTTVLVCI